MRYTAHGTTSAPTQHPKITGRSGTTYSNMSMGWKSKDIQEMKTEIILRRDELFNSMMGTYLTIKKISGLLYKNEPTREQKKAVTEAMNEMLGDCRSKSNKALFSVALCRATHGAIRCYDR